MSGPEEAARGEEPGALPVEAGASKPNDAAAKSPCGTTGDAGAASAGTPRRRRGNRSGRRRRKPAAEGAARSAESSATGADARSAGRPSP